MRNASRPLGGQRNLVDSQWRRRQLLDRTVRVAEGERARIAANLHDDPIAPRRRGALDLAGSLAVPRRKRAAWRGPDRPERGDPWEMMSELRPRCWTKEARRRCVTRCRAGAHDWDRGKLETPHARCRLTARRWSTESCRKRWPMWPSTPGRPYYGLLTQSGAGVRVVVWDNGKGFDASNTTSCDAAASSGGYARASGTCVGSLRSKSAPLTGTQVIAWVPSTLSAGRQRTRRPPEEEVVPVRHDDANMATTSRGPV